MPRNDADQLTVKAIVQIARGLGKTTIAEFVQDDETTRSCCATTASTWPRASTSAARSTPRSGWRRLRLAPNR